MGQRDGATVSNEITLTTKAVGGEKLALAICEALGIEPGRTCRVVIDLDARYWRSEPVRVEITQIGETDLLDVGWDSLWIPEED